MARAHWSGSFPSSFSRYMRLIRLRDLIDFDFLIHRERSEWSIATPDRRPVIW